MVKVLKSDIVRNLLLTGILGLLLLIAAKSPNRTEPTIPTSPTVPVCHAITEDSDISDCDYHNGAWWTK